MQIKQASMTLVKMYMKRVTMELESIRNSDRESIQDSLLLQGVHFAYRAHQVIISISFMSSVLIFLGLWGFRNLWLEHIISWYLPFTLCLLICYMLLDRQSTCTNFIMYQVVTLTLACFCSLLEDWTQKQCVLLKR